MGTQIRDKDKYMSRWVEAFEAHGFQNAWEGLKAALDQATVDDQSVTTSVNELARLKKAIAYLDETIRSVDPELVPTSVWDLVEQQAPSCRAHIEQYNSNRNIGHISKANTIVDNLLPALRPYMIPAGKVAKVLQAAIKDYTKTINEYGKDFREEGTTLLAELQEYKRQSKELTEDIESAKDQSDEFYSEIFGDDDSAIGIKGEIAAIFDDFAKKHSEIVDYYNETLVDEATRPSTKREVAEAKEAIQADKDDIEELLKDVRTEIEELSNFHKKIFGKTSNDGTREGGLAGELDTRKKALTDFESIQKTKYKALTDQIETLLPGATSAGLATAYHEMKKSFDKNIRNATWLFYFSIGILIFGSLALSLETIQWSHITFSPIGDLDSVIKGLLYKIPFYGPALWLAFFASKRRSEYQRLQQEYAHKEALAKSYDSYKKQLEALDDSDQTLRKDLITKAIDAIAYNASVTLDRKHGDKMPIQDLAEKIADKLPFQDIAQKVVEKISK